MSNALSLLVADENLRNRMGVASLLKAKSFSAIEMTEKTLGVYKSLMLSSAREKR
jgi:hypothetical protein